MNTVSESISKTQVKLTITLLPDEVRPYLEKAAKHISEHVEVPGFRKGKATYEAVAGNVGEMRVLEEAIEPMVRITLVEAVKQENISSVGMPSVDVEKMVPGNEFVYTATLSLMPEVKKLAQYKKLSIEAKPTAASDKDVEKALKDLTRMQTKEARALAGHTVTDRDLAVIDLQMTKDLVPVEGGQGKGWRVYMNEDFYLSELKEGLVGMKEGDEKTIAVTFPKDHYQKHLAGQKVACAVRLSEVYILDTPAIDEVFAKSLGMESVQKLREQIASNIEEENKTEEGARQERAMLERLADKSAYSEIPDSMVESELDKMMNELEHSVTRQGATFEDYLGSIKKTVDDLRKEMQGDALMRVKVGLVLRTIAKEEGVTVDEKELDEEIEKQVKFFDASDERQKQVQSPEYRDHLAYRLRNQKVVDLLRAAMVK
ncbi:MAG: trigger factor [Patescibacteria group bacterium]